jgi:hypothetical protein
VNELKKKEETKKDANGLLDNKALGLVSDIKNDTTN